MSPLEINPARGRVEQRRQQFQQSLRQLESDVLPQTAMGKVMRLVGKLPGSSMLPIPENFRQTPIDMVVANDRKYARDLYKDLRETSLEGGKLLAFHHQHLVFRYPVVEEREESEVKNWPAVLALDEFLRARGEKELKKDQDTETESYRVMIEEITDTEDPEFRLHQRQMVLGESDRLVLVTSPLVKLMQQASIQADQLYREAVIKFSTDLTIAPSLRRLQRFGEHVVEGLDDQKMREKAVVAYLKMGLTVTELALCASEIGSQFDPSNYELLEKLSRDAQLKLDSLSTPLLSPGSKD